jgi:hypothetical protein
LERAITSASLALSLKGGLYMKGEARERFMELCALAAEEQDPKKLLALITEINVLLQAKETWLLANRKAETP